MDSDFIKEKLLKFVKQYLSFFVVAVMCIVFLLVDLLVFSKEEDPRIVFGKAVIYLVMSITINALMRTQGITIGKNDKEYITTKRNYEDELNSNLENTDRLDDWCEAKNEQKRVNIIKTQLRYNHLNYEKYVNGEYVMPTERKAKKEYKMQYNRKQRKAIEFCDKVVVEQYNSVYLTSELERLKKRIVVHNTSVNSFLNKKFGTNIITGVLSSIVFAYLAVSLVQNPDWSNIIYSLIKIVTWIGSGTYSLFMAFMYITQTYTSVLSDKTYKLAEFRNWNEEHPRVVEKPKENKETKVKK